MSQHPKITLRLGTRASMLAQTQAKMVQKHLQEHFPALEVSLVLIQTKGDLQQQQPLWQMEGENFFTKELDEALKRGEVDAVVHSGKDLSSQRPSGFRLLAFPPRDLPQDMLLIPKQRWQSLNQTQTKEPVPLILGTSSPRRLFQLQQALGHYLPNNGRQWKLATKALRGNINTRLKKTLAGEVDGLILAAAGLNRVLSLEENHVQVLELLEQFQWKLLPLSDFTGAPVQGILAIEALASRQDLLPYFSTLNCPVSEFSYHQEKATLQRFGGGCHLPLGAYCWQPPAALKRNEVPWMVINGDPQVLKLQNKTHQKTHQWCSPISLSEKIAVPGPLDHVFVGLDHQRAQQLIQKISPGKKILADQWLIKRPQEHSFFTTPPGADGDILFYLHSRHGLGALKKILKDYPTAQLWVAGAALHRECAREGLWVMGDCDLQGSDFFETLKTLPLGALLPKVSMGLTSKEQTNLELEPLREINSYDIDEQPMSAQWWQQLAEVKYFFWTSNSQFKRYQSALNDQQLHFHHDSLHSCGPGRTGQKLSQLWQEEGLSQPLLIAPSLACWLQWLYQ